MLDFICKSCGIRVQADDALSGKLVLCPVCNLAMTAPPPGQTAIATPAHAPLAKVKPPADNTFREGEPDARPPLPPIRAEAPHILMRMMPVWVVGGIVALLAALLIPAVQKVREAAARTQTINNLKRVGLAMHGFHDAHRRLPHNGTVVAKGGDPTTGSWAFQILPFIDQAVLFNRPNVTDAIDAYMCPGRGRPNVSTTGAWSDYAINPWLNDDHGVVNAPDKKRPLVAITDGTSNTIFAGHGNIDPNLYSSNAAIAQSIEFFRGGQHATARRTTTSQRDTVGVADLNWGSPFPHGPAMCMCDGVVRFFPYATYTGGVIASGVSTTQTNTLLGIFLTPTGGEFPNP